MTFDRPSGLASIPAEWSLPGQSASDVSAGAPDSEAGVGRVITLTPSAEVEVRRLIIEEGKPGLRLGIKGGGCSGLSYMLEFTNEEEGDTVIDFDGFKVFLDRKSTIYLSGITLDFQSGLDGRGFVFNNPQASNTCGCGESFSL
jgi:iron-sulfur cluster assembly protein